MALDSTASIKLLEWLGSSRHDLRECPEDVRDAIGFALYKAQLGARHPSAKPLKGFGGAGVLEVVEDHDGNTYRAVYTVKFRRKIYVLHVFQKKSVKGAKTPKHEIGLVQARLKMAAVRYKAWTAAHPEVQHDEEE
jgi:phage-related protein